VNIRSVEPTFNDVNGFGASPDGLGATVRFAAPGEQWLGADDQAPAPVASPARKTFAILYGVAGLAGAAIGAYHGYKRNDSVGWAIGWSLLGSLAPIIVIPVALAQGIGKKPSRSNR
jgi:hypothetical protein